MGRGRELGRIDARTSSNTRHTTSAQARRQPQSLVVVGRSAQGRRGEQLFTAHGQLVSGSGGVVIQARGLLTGVTRGERTCGGRGMTLKQVQARGHRRAVAALEVVVEVVVAVVVDHMMRVLVAMATVVIP